MATILPPPADGPRPLHSDEWPLLDNLVSRVFRPEMFHDYPQLFNDANRHNLRVVREGDAIVTHVGIAVRDAVLLGCGVRVASMGAVASGPEVRGKGYASAAVQDAFDHAEAEGADLMYISGGRNLYTRVGCRPVGCDRRFTLREDQARAVDTQSIAVIPASATDIATLVALHESEAVRYLRPLEDWERALACTVVMNTPSDFWLVARHGETCAYVIVHRPSRLRARTPDDPPLVRVVEFAGDRQAIVAALPALVAHYRAATLEVHVQQHDVVLGRLLDGAGLSSIPEATSGTVRVINFARFMHKMTPLIASRVGTTIAHALVFTATAPPASAVGGFALSNGQTSIHIADHGALGTFLFGGVDGVTADVSGDADLRATVARALPFPSLWYGVNYV